MEHNIEDRLRVGVITSSHGIKGEVKVYPTTDDNDRFKTLKKVLSVKWQRDSGGQLYILQIFEKYGYS